MEKTISWKEQKWKDEKTWQGFVDGSTCPMCEKNIYDDENDFSFLVVELKSLIVRLPKNQHYYGWLVLSLKNHATELHQLTNEELSQYWIDVSTVSKALQKIHNAPKINYCILGNHVPHLHCHLIVRQFDHDPAIPIKMDAEVRFLEENEYKKMIIELRNEINA